MKTFIVIFAFLFAPLAAQAGISQCRSGGESIACPDNYESVCEETFRSSSGGVVKYNCPADGGEKSPSNSEDSTKGNELDTYKEPEADKEKEAEKDSE